MESTSTRKRPLSPFLTVYRWQYSMALSILHRVMGCALSVGLLLLAYWLMAAATGNRLRSRRDSLCEEHESIAPASEFPKHRAVAEAAATAAEAGRTA